MASLWPCRPLAAGETATSYVARLARLNWITSTPSFCQELGMPLTKVGMGDPEALRRLSELTGEDAGVLGERCIVPMGRDHLRLAGESFVCSALRRSGPHICPACLREDLIASSDGPGAAVYERSAWKLASVRTCPRHGLRLMRIEGRIYRARVHDFGELVGPLLPRLDQLAAAATVREASGLERYACARLDRRDTGAPFLDGLEMHLALHFCEVLGISVLFERYRMLHTLDDDQRWAVGAAGFALASKGEPAIRAHLASLQARYSRTRRGRDQAQAQLGTIYCWLRGRHDDPAYAPLRNLVVRHLVETDPLGPGDVVLGTKITHRRLHSIHTAHLEHGLHPKRLRKVLIAAGVVSKDQDHLSDDRVLFSVEQGEPVLTKLAEALSMSELPSFLGTSLMRARNLVRDGMIVPMVANWPGGNLFQAFARSDLNAFLASLTTRAETVGEVPTGAIDIEIASRMFTRRTSEVIRAIQHGRVRWVGRLASRHGLAAILVQKEEMREALWGALERPFLVRDAAREMGADAKVVEALIARGHLPTREERSPFKRAPILAIDPAAFDVFRERYVSLSEAARESGTHHLKLQARLAAQGVTPAITRDEVGATFYLRGMV